MPRKKSPPVSGDNKYCHSCSSVKSRTAFYTERRKPDGLTSQCKGCIQVSQDATLEVKAALDGIFRRIAARNKDARMIDLVGLDVEPVA